MGECTTTVIVKREVAECVQVFRINARLILFAIELIARWTKRFVARIVVLTWVKLVARVVALRIAGKVTLVVRPAEIGGLAGQKPILKVSEVLWIVVL